MKIPVKFATESLPGTVYYTQYRRQFSHACPTTSQTCTYNSGSYSPGQICEVGYQNTKPASSATYPTTVRAIDLTQKTAPNTDPFGGVTKCPVCHSVSANGRVFVSGSHYEGSGYALIEAMADSRTMLPLEFFTTSVSYSRGLRS
jgi:hypothetical protein